MAYEYALMAPSIITEISCDCVYYGPPIKSLRIYMSAKRAADIRIISYPLLSSRRILRSTDVLSRSGAWPLAAQNSSAFGSFRAR